jgi:fumarylacetoacetase
MAEPHASIDTSWVGSANSHADFPLQNLPLGVFEPVPADGAVAGAGGGPRGGVAIGDRILDLGVALELGAFEPGLVAVAQAAAGPALNDFFELGASARRALRVALHELLRAGSAFEAQAR